MLITCPQCLTTYDIPDAAREENAQFRCVKCGCVWGIDDDVVAPAPEDAPDTGKIDRVAIAEEHLETQNDLKNGIDLEKIESREEFDFENAGKGIKDIPFFSSDFEDGFQNVEDKSEKETGDIPVFNDDFFQPAKKIVKPPAFLKWILPLYFVSLTAVAVAVYLFFFRAPLRPPVTMRSIAYETTQEEYKTYLLLRSAMFNNTDKEIFPKTFSVRFSDENDRLLTTATVDSPVAVLPPHGMEKVEIKIERPPAKTAKAVVTLNKYKTE